MTSYAVPFTPPQLFPATNDMRAALAIRGPEQWQRMADGEMWLAGRGAQLVGCGPAGGWIAPGSSEVFTFYAWPHEQCLSRTWWITLVADNEAGAHGTITANSDTASTWEVPALPPLAGLIPPTLFGFHTPHTVLHSELVDSPATGGLAMNIVVANSSASTASVRVLAVSCYEQPRTNLVALTGQPLPDRDTDNARWTINSDAGVHGGARASVYGVSYGVIAGLNQGRRAHLFSWCSAESKGLSSSATSEPGSGNVFPFGIKLNSRFLRTGTNTVKVAYRAKCAATWHFKMIGAFDTVSDTHTDASPGWHFFNFTVAAENMSSLASDGGISGEDITVKIWTSSGGSPITLYGIAIGEG